MSLENKIDLKLTEELKNKEKNIFPTLRLIISAIKDLKISKKVREGYLKDNEVIGILKKMIKQRNDSCEAYKKAGRDDLLNNEKKEIEIINEFLPTQLNENETAKLCEDIVKNTNSNSMKDMGKVMGALKTKHGDILDFSVVNRILKTLLNK